MKNNQKLCMVFMLFALLCSIFVFPVGAEETLTTTYDEIETVTVEINDDIPLMAVAEAPSDTTVISEDTEEVFSGNAIGRWLDKTFYKTDYAIFAFFGKLQSSVLTPIVGFITHFGDTEFAVPMILVGLILCLFKKTRKYGITLFLAIIIGTLFTNVVLKNVCGRVRPYVTLSGDTDFMRWYEFAGSQIESDNSFPSGHTTCAFEIATALFLTVNNRKIKWVFPVYAVVIMCTRLYLMVHYCSDVCAGVIVGISSGILAFVIMNALMKIPFIRELEVKEFLEKLKKA